MEAKDTVMNDEQITKIVQGFNFSSAGAPPGWWLKEYRKMLLAQAEISFERGGENERERIIKYLKIRWCQYESNEITGMSRHTFALPKDWEQALKEEE